MLYVSAPIEVICVLDRMKHAKANTMVVALFIATTYITSYQLSYNNILYTIFIEDALPNSVFIEDALSSTVFIEYALCSRHIFV